MTTKRQRISSAKWRLKEMENNPNDRSHGTPTGYNYGCRCDRCKKAVSKK